MNEWDITFGERPWERLLTAKHRGDGVSAANLLTLTEEEGEEALEEALLTMEESGLVLDVSDLPKTAGAGEAARRLRQEIHLADKGLKPEDLPENDPLRLYLQELSAAPAFGEEGLLAQRIAQGDASATEALANLGLRRVLELAKGYVGYGVLLLDLIQEGSLGLWQGICRYRDGDYAAFRDSWIRFYLARAVTLQARANGIGGKMRQALEDYRSTDERLLMELGRNPTLEEIAEAMRWSMEEAASVQKMMDDARQMSRVRKEPEPREESEEDQDMESTAEFRMRQRILDLMASLTPEEARLLTLRFGLEGEKPLSPQEAGLRLGLTPAEALALEAAALTKLRSKEQ